MQAGEIDSSSKQTKTDRNMQEKDTDLCKLV